MGKLGIRGGCRRQLVETKMMHGLVESWVMIMIVVMHGCRVFCVGREQINIVVLECCSGRRRFGDSINDCIVDRG